MATYVPNATQTTEPLESQTVESAALEFRTLKARVNALDAAVAVDDLTDLRVPETSIAVLPSVAARAGKVLGFDAGGDPTMVEVAGATDPSLRSDLAASSGASLVGYLPARVGAVQTTVEGKLRESVSVKDFGAVGDGVTDDTAAIQAAINAVSTNYDPTVYSSNSPANGPCTLFFPSGFYKISSVLIITKKIALLGEGQSEFSSGSRILQNDPNQDLFRIAPISTGMSYSIENLTLRHNGSGMGYLVNVTKTTAGCNSQRYVGCTFGPPALSAVKVIGDDVEFLNCLFDVGQGSACIQLGTNTTGEVASNVRVIGCNFFQQTVRVFLAYQIDGLTITGCCNYSDGSTRTLRFFDAIDSLPILVKNITITGNTLKHARGIFAASGAIDTVISGNTCTLLGNGTGEIVSAIALTGNTDGLVINGNLFSGTFDFQHFYSDAGGPVVNANITGNVFKNTGGVGDAFQIRNTLGVINNNHLTGFTTPQLSQSVAFSSLLPTGQVLNANMSFSETVTIIGAIVGDAVSVSSEGSLALGIVRFAYVSALNTVTLKYVNTSAITTGQGPENLKIKVSR